MHPEISLLPSRVFYDGRLRDGPEMKEKTAKPWHNELRLGVYKFFSAMNGREEPGRSGHSYFNREECNVAVAIYNRLLKQFSSFNFDYRIGVVSMYRSQVAELRLAFKSRFGQDVLTKVDFNTVDGFQGQEKDIIILSCVRAGPSLQTVGFLAGKHMQSLSSLSPCHSNLTIHVHRCTAHKRSHHSFTFIPLHYRERTHSRAQRYYLEKHH